MSVLLFIDVLGAKQRWQAGGVEAAHGLFNRFYRLAVGSVRSEGANQVLDGAIESDSAAFVCESVSVALRITRHLFRAAFQQPATRRNPDSVWLRGAIVQHEAGVPLRSTRPLATPLAHISLFSYSVPLFEAISVEKSGYRGMRLLLPKALVTDAVRAEFRIPFGERSWIPIRRLNYSVYPKNGDLVDFLWMADGEEEIWNDRRRLMGDRLRRSSLNAEELAQAAATEIVFQECAAIRGSIVGRGGRRPGVAARWANRRWQPTALAEE